MTMQRDQMNVQKTIKIDDGKKISRIHKLAIQFNIGLPDMNAEVYDLNRKSFETIPEYIKRVWNSRILSDSECIGMQEMTPEKQIDLNTKI